MVMEKKKLKKIQLIEEPKSEDFYVRNLKKH